MADTTIDLLKNSSYVGKMDELIAAVKSGGGTASDVEWNNVKNKPTTIGGYGITDAKIENGTITLGNQTITPLTSAPVTSVNSQTGAVVLTANDVSAIPSTLTGTAGQVLTKTADGQEWKDVDIPTALPNPNALTFTGAVTGSYDGSAPLSVEIPSGGGGTSEREWSMLANVDIAEIGGSTNIELTGLDNLTEFFIKWASPKNESTQNSAYTVYINGTNLNQIVPITNSSGNIMFGYSYLRFNGLVWTIQRSAGAISEENTTLNYQNAYCPYNLPLGIGAATNIKLTPPLTSYQAVSGNIIIYGR